MNFHLIPNPKKRNDKVFGNLKNSWPNFLRNRALSVFRCYDNLPSRQKTKKQKKEKKERKRKSVVPLETTV